MPELALQTGKHYNIRNCRGGPVPTPGELATALKLKRDWNLAKHKTPKVDFNYNCHGLTFGGRRTQITKDFDIKQILLDDGYQGVLSVKDVEIGDIIVYYDNNGLVEHSGIVVGISDGLINIPTIISKWGHAQEVVHKYNYGPYPLNTKFYRIP